MIEREGVVGVALAERTSLPDAMPYEEAGIKALVRQALRIYGLGRKDGDRPFADIIEPGMTVLLKPNWVSHFNPSGAGMDCMVTHPAVIEAVLDEIVLARPRKVIIGDAPIQLCQFESLAPAEWQKSLIARQDTQVQIIDFRRQVVNGNEVGDGVSDNARSLDKYVLFDLAQDSLLEPVSTPAGRFRVTNYDPAALARAHRPGKHQYVICREAFDVDVVINLPKLKTHRKAGITASLKNIVGLCGNKDYLPHHRVGGSGADGDCYPGRAPIKRTVENLLDIANSKINTPAYRGWHRLAHRLLRLHARVGDAEIEGGWQGNDTCWRMVLDLNRILLYGSADGILSDKARRRVFSLTDAVVVGEGEGPLAPTALTCGVITFGASSAYADLVHCALMGFEADRLPLVREAFSDFRYKLVCGEKSACRVRILDKEYSVSEFGARFGTTARPPRGWDSICSQGLVRK